MQESVPSSFTVHQLKLPTPLPVGDVNAFLIRSDTGQILVDCGLREDQCQAVFTSGLRELGVEAAQLDALVLTHGHVDHVGATSRLRAAGVPVYAHPDVAGWLDPGGRWDQYRQRFYESFYVRMGMPQEVCQRAIKQFLLLASWTDRSVVDVPLRDREELRMLPGWRVLYVPGHAQAAIALWHEGSGTLLAGDQVLPLISPNPVVEPVAGADDGSTASRSRSLMQYRENLTQLRDLNLQVVYPGHGDPITAVQPLLTRRLNEQVERKERLLATVTELGQPSTWEVAATYFAHHLNQPSLILSETVGYLDWLAAEGALTEQTDATGVVRWQR